MIGIGSHRAFYYRNNNVNLAGMMKILFKGIIDVFAAVKKIQLAFMLGGQDVRRRYRRSILGPFWITLSMGIMIGTMGIVFSQIYKSPMADFFPYLSSGLVIWGFIVTSISDSCLAFISADSIIRQLPLPLFIHVLRVLIRSSIIFFHNFAIIPIVFIICKKGININVLWAIPGFILFIINILWCALLLAIVCTRYRDLQQIVISMLQVAFYVTPIMWLPHLLPEHLMRYVVNLNPAFHLIEIIRAPLLGNAPSLKSWLYMAMFAVIGWSTALLFFGKYRKRISYWL